MIILAKNKIVIISTVLIFLVVGLFIMNSPVKNSINLISSDLSRDWPTFQNEHYSIKYPKELICWDDCKGSQIIFGEKERNPKSYEPEYFSVSLINTSSEGLTDYTKIINTFEEKSQLNDFFAQPFPYDVETYGKSLVDSKGYIGEAKAIKFKHRQFGNLLAYGVLNPRDYSEIVVLYCNVYGDLESSEKFLNYCKESFSTFKFK